MEREPATHLSNVPHEVYRGASIGRALFDALDLLIAQDRFPSQHGYKVVSNFDIAIAEVLRKITSKVSIKGQLDRYNFANEVWLLDVRNGFMAFDREPYVQFDRLRIVAMPAKDQDKSVVPHTEHRGFFTKPRTRR